MEADGSSERLAITPDWTLGELKAAYPGVELTLFAFFGIGSRERSGFAASERLSDLLRRHLIFDAARACARLTELALEDLAYQVEPLVALQESSRFQWVDARSEQEYRQSRLPGSRLLAEETVRALRLAPEFPVLLVCGDGSQSPAAARHLRRLGLKAHHLRGGLLAWSEECDETFPINYPLQESPARWHLLADGRTLRWRRGASLDGWPWRLWRLSHLRASEAGRSLLDRLPGLEQVAVSPRSFAAKGDFEDLWETAKALRSWTDRLEVWSAGGEESCPDQERRELQRVLTQEAPVILGSHKGTVEVGDYQDRVLSLALGGGCAGCASSAITAQRELAAALYQHVPLLDRIVAS